MQRSLASFYYDDETFDKIHALVITAAYMTPRRLMSGIRAIAMGVWFCSIWSEAACRSDPSR
jgi:hypothetical protein